MFNTTLLGVSEMHQLSLFFFTVETYPVFSWSQVGWWWGGEGRGVHRAYPPVIFRSPSADIPASQSVSQQTTGQAQTFRGEGCNWITTKSKRKFPLVTCQEGA